MIPMRDGVKLHTVILVPKGAKGAPILLTRTPYDANAAHQPCCRARTSVPILNGYDNATDVIVEGGYIRVVQDVRGKYGSEGDYVMNRPLHGPQNPTPVDHATDTYDTIDWLVKNIPESNGKVGILGISYDGFTAADGAGQSASGAQGVGADESDGRRLDGRRLVPQWRLPPTEHALHLRAGGTRDNTVKWWTEHFDDYDMYMQAGSAGELGRRHGLEQIGFWRKVTRASELRRLLARPGGGQASWPTQPLKVPVMLVDSLWDQEDIYGAIAVYKAIKPKDIQNDKVFLVHRALASRPGDRRRQLARARSNSTATPALYFRREHPAPVPRPVSEGRRAERGCRAGHRVRDRHERMAQLPVLAGWLRKRLRDPADAALSGSRAEAELHRAQAGRRGVRRIRLRSRQARAVPRAADPADRLRRRAMTWSEWLVDDQREASGRPDVLAFDLGRAEPRR